MVARRRAVVLLVVVVFAGIGAAAVAPRDDPDKTSLWQLIEKIAAARGFAKELDAVVKHQYTLVAESEAAIHPFARVKRMLAEPWTVPVVAKELRDAVAAPVRADGKVDAKMELVPLVDDVARFFDLDPARLGEGGEALDRLFKEIADPKTVETALLERLSEYIEACHHLAAAATANLEEADAALLREQFPEFCEIFFRSHFPKAEIESSRALFFEKYKRLAQRVNRLKLLVAARAVARLADPPFLEGLGKRLAKTPRTSEKLDGVGGDLIATVGRCPESRVVLLGAGKSKVTAPFALAIDLGGDDTWTQAANADDAKRLASVVLELDGNDTYESDGRGPAYASTGCALLVDAKGNDKYLGKRLAQGASSLGFAALLDRGGNDQYLAEDFAQGYSFGGVGLLLDRDGKDSYGAWAYAQGASDGPGFAALADGKGDDHYVANGHWPDVYGDSGPGSFHGASQGYSFGFLVDDGGDDQYDVGGLALGGAAETGIAILLDGGGNDRYGGGGGNDSQGGSGAGEYHEKEGVPQSFGVLVDLGGGKDSFTRKGRDEETIATGDKYGVFVHAKAKSVEALLEPATLKKALDTKPAAPKQEPKADPKSDKPAKPKH